MGNPQKEDFLEGKPSQGSLSTSLGLITKCLYWSVHCYLGQSVMVREEGLDLLNIYGVIYSNVVSSMWESELSMESA